MFKKNAWRYVCQGWYGASWYHRPRFHQLQLMPSTSWCKGTCLCKGTSHRGTGKREKPVEKREAWRRKGAKNTYQLISKEGIWETVKTKAKKKRKPSAYISFISIACHTYLLGRLESRAFFFLRQSCFHLKSTVFITRKKLGMKSGVATSSLCHEV